MAEMKLEAEDAELVAAALAGNTSAFNRLVERYFGTIYAIAYAHLVNREAAEDLAQEVFLRAYLHLSSLGSAGRFSAWLGQIARHLAADWLRRDQSASRLARMAPIDDLGDRIGDEEAKGAREIVEATERHKAVQDAIAKLPPAMRELIMLHYVEGLTKKEIAQRLEIHPTTVGRQLDKALAAIRGLLEPVLRESAPAMQASAGAAFRTIVLITAVSAMAATEHSALAEAATGTVQLASGPWAASGGATGIGALLSSLKAILMAIAKGGCIMGIKAKITAAVAAVALVSGGVYFYSHQSQTPTPAVTPVPTGVVVVSPPQPKALSPAEMLLGRDTSFERGGFKNSWMILLGPQGNPLTRAMPSTIVKERDVLGLPLHGTLRFGQKRAVAFCLDESNGPGAGHDRLVFDWNGNGDLTDDRVYPLSEELSWRGLETPGGGREALLVFGPIEVPPSKEAERWQPIYRAEVEIFYGKDKTEILWAGLKCDNLNGLETTVEVNGVREKIWITDGNANMRLGDKRVLSVQNGPEGKSWNWSDLGDVVVRTREDLGGAGSGRLWRWGEFLSSVIYFGSNPCAMSLSEDLSGLRIEPYQGPTGELEVPNHVASLVLVWQNAAGEWATLTLCPNGTPVKVPVGTYYLFSSYVTGKDKDGGVVAAKSWTWSSDKPGNPVTVEANKTATLACGGPLAVEVLDRTVRDSRRVGDAVRAIQDALGSAIGGTPPPPRHFVFDLKITGAGGEEYRREYVRRWSQGGETGIYIRFRIFDESGMEVAGCEARPAGPGDHPRAIGTTASWSVPKHLVGRKIRVVPEIDLGDLETVCRPLEIQL
jgi:RNA polymerase sigma-70 factor (ECF subfamily)